MIIYGKQVCLYTIYNYKQLIKTIFINKNNILPKDLFIENKSKIKFIEDKWAQQMSKGKNHQGILMEVEPFEEALFENIKNGNFIIILDGLTDSGNIGAIVRSAFSLGVDSIIISGINKLDFSSIIRTSSGALFNMPLMISKNNILDIIHQLKQLNFKIYGSSAEQGTPIQFAKFSKKKVLILGSEDVGISKRVKSKIDEFISIIIKRDFNSLNVSAAASILIHRMEDDN